MDKLIRKLLRKARSEARRHGAVSLTTEVELDLAGYSLSSLSRDLQPYRSF